MVAQAIMPISNLHHMGLLLYWAAYVRDIVASCLMRLFDMGTLGT